MRESSNTKDRERSERDSEIMELYRQLGILNLSLDTVYVIVIAILLNIEFIKWSIIGTLDKINNTKNAEKIGDLSEVPKMSNLMFIYATGIFLLINFSAFKNSVSSEETAKREKCKAWKAFLSSLLIFIATGLTRDNLEL